MNDVKVCVLRIEGTNCEDEMYQAFRSAGASPEKVHLNQLNGRSPIDMRRNIDDYDMIALPGGFSAGDYVRAGAIFAARIKSDIGPRLKRFVDSGKPVLGVCNGFQILVELGMLPAFGGTMSSVPDAALYTNDSARFECRPTLLRNDNRGKCIFTRGMEKRIVMFPSAHGEGKFMSADNDIVQRLDDNDQIVFRYVAPKGKTVYPWNPNGSPSDIAGICNPDGNVLGLMPHPERVISRFTHPDWTRGYDCEEGDGYGFFRTVINNIG